MKNQILCSAATRKDVVAALLKEKGGSLFGSQVLTVSQFISAFFQEETSLYAQSKLLQNLSLNFFEEAVKDYALVKELVSYKEEFARYDVKLADLPIDEEIKTMLQTLKGRNYTRFFQQLSDMDASSVLIHEEDYPFFEEKVISLLKERGARTFSVYPVFPHQGYKVRCQTERDQFEAAVQHIIRHRLPLEECGFVLCDESKATLLSTVLNRYRVPFAPFPILNKAARKLTALLHYRRNPTSAAVKKIACLEIFGKNHPAFLRYLDHYLDEGGIFRPFKRLQEIDEKKYAFAEVAEEIRKPLAEGLLHLQESGDLRSFLSEAYTYIADGSEDALALKSFLQERGKEIDDDYEEYLLRELSSLSVRATQEGGLAVVPLTKALYRRYLFVFDCNEDVFPAFHGLSGLVKEEDCRDSSYPAIEDRYENHLKQLSYLDKSEETYYFTPEVSYAGKPKESALLLEEKKLIPFPIPLYRVKEVPYSSRHQLTEANAATAFFTAEGTLKGSVSSLEMFTKNPYDYFLKYGLGLRTPESDEPDALYFGNLLHRFFEEIVRKYGKDYPSGGKSEVTEFLQREKTNLQCLYPLKEKDILAFLKRFEKLLIEELAFLAMMEKGTLFQPEYCEYRFEEYWPLEGEERIQLRGSIDRIDGYGEFFRVLDYKSSEKTLKEKEVQSGLSLQLLTYLILFAHLHKRQGFGCFYVSVQPPEEDCQSYTGGAKGIREKEKSTKTDVKGLRLDGSVFLADTTAIIPEGDAYKGSVKNGFRKDCIWDWQLAKQALDTVYRSIYQQLRKGEIPLAPTKNALDFPEFPDIYLYPDGKKESIRNYFDYSLQKGESEDE